MWKMIKLYQNHFAIIEKRPPSSNAMEVKLRAFLVSAWADTFFWLHSSERRNMDF